MTVLLARAGLALALATALACPLRVFTSPAAVAFAQGPQPLPSRPGQRWLAVGSGTAGALRRAAAAQGRSSHLSLWAGQGVAAVRPQPAAQLMATLTKEWRVACRQFSAATAH